MNKNGTFSIESTSNAKIMSAFSLLVILPMIFASQYCKDSEMTGKLN